MYIAFYLTTNRTPIKHLNPEMFLKDPDQEPLLLEDPGLEALLLEDTELEALLLEDQEQETQNWRLYS